MPYKDPDKRREYQKKYKRGWRRRQRRQKWGRIVSFCLGLGVAVLAYWTTIWVDYWLK